MVLMNKGLNKRLWSLIIPAKLLEFARKNTIGIGSMSPLWLQRNTVILLVFSFYGFTYLVGPGHHPNSLYQRSDHRVNLAVEPAGRWLFSLF